MRFREIRGRISDDRSSKTRGGAFFSSAPTLVVNRRKFPFQSDEKRTISSFLVVPRAENWLLGGARFGPRPCKIGRADARGSV